MISRGLICKQYNLPYCGKPEANCDTECAEYEPTCTCNAGKWNQCVLLHINGCDTQAHAGCYGGFKPRLERKLAAAGKGE